MTETVAVVLIVIALFWFVVSMAMVAGMSRPVDKGRSLLASDHLDRLDDAVSALDGVVDSAQGVEWGWSVEVSRNVEGFSPIEGAEADPGLTMSDDDDGLARWRELWDEIDDGGDE